MATFQPTVTPMRKVPGAFFNTPAPARNDIVRRRLFNETAESNSGAVGAPASSSPAQQRQRLPAPEETSPPIVKAARSINDALAQDEAFPEIDTFCKQGAYADYETLSVDSTALPFHKVNMYPIPDAILDKLNRGHVNTRLGLFAEINHAWASIDSSLFLWDYTIPEPEVIGYEDATQNITAIALVPPRAGVFVASITHLLVVATGSEVVLLGVEAKATSAGMKQIELYQTRMMAHRGGADISLVVGTAKGRIFFGGDSDTDVHELYYQQEEKWFSSRCGKINHTRAGWKAMPISIWTSTEPDFLIDMVVDDSRDLLYTLSNRSTIRTFHIEDGKLTKVIEKERNHWLRDVTHTVYHRTSLFDDRTKIVSLSPISAQEASRLHLMALTDSGCRLYLSATSSAQYSLHTSSNTAPQSMQVHCIKFPPPTNTSKAKQGAFTQAPEQSLDIETQFLRMSMFGHRFAPGYFLDIVQREKNQNVDRLFVSAPDTGKIKYNAPTTNLKFWEVYNWIDLGSETNQNCRAIAIGMSGAPFSAANRPLGFGNELAVQFDQPPTEFAVLTNSGVHVIRRRRFVDIFASTLKGSGPSDNVAAAIRKLITQYSRIEIVSAALAVACGQGNDSRSGSIRAPDPQTEERARAVFVEFGGQPSFPQERDNGELTVDNVRLSSRYHALARYVSRLVRTVWKSKVIGLGTDAVGGITVNSGVALEKLRTVQDSLERLQRFLKENQGTIQGLSGPQSISRRTNETDEIALQAEHQALYGLQRLMESMAEGMSFVQMLFDERVVEIYVSLEEEFQRQFAELTFEALFSQPAGKDLAKVLVKSIVNRNIKVGSNVDTVADALRRRCGNFCSPDDVVIFKAQEQLQRASEQINNPSLLRQTLCESLRLFERVAISLTQGNLVNAVEQYVALRYYAGAIQLCLVVAREKDRGNKALSWYRDGKPAGDPREALFAARKGCYDLIHEVLLELDKATESEAEILDGRPSLAATKRAEAYTVVNDSDDEIFHFDLYEWYFAQNWTDRILATDSRHVVTYLQRLATTDVRHAELLCRFYTHRNRFFEAAQVQADLAESDFAMGIKERITLLSLAKGNASVNTLGVSRQQQQELAHRVTELLEIAHIQDDLLEQLLEDTRLQEDKKAELQSALDGRVQTLTELFNSYADQAGYHDICLYIFHAADYQSNPRIIADTWEQLVATTHEKYLENHQRHVAGELSEKPPCPYELISSKIRDIASRTSIESFIFPIDTLIPLICEYAIRAEQDERVGADPCWPVKLFLGLGLPHSLVVRVLERIYDAPDAPFVPRRARRTVCLWINSVVSAWLRDVERKGTGTRGGGENALGTWVSELLERCDEFLGSVAGGNTGGRGGAPVEELEEALEVQRATRLLRREMDGLAEPGARDSLRFR